MRKHYEISKFLHVPNPVIQGSYLSESMRSTEKCMAGNSFLYKTGTPSQQIHDRNLPCPKLSEPW
jgi:hypothetical protein